MTKCPCLTTLAKITKKPSRSNTVQFNIEEEIKYSTPA